MKFIQWQQDQEKSSGSWLDIEAALGGDVVLNLMGTDLPTLAAVLAA